MFARAIGDENVVYTDASAAAATEAGGIVAPPTFVQASAQYDPHYPLRPRPGQLWFGSGGTASGARADGGGGGNDGLLHAEQHYEYHRPVRAGDVLTAEEMPGRTWEKTGRRSGKLIFAETITEYRNQAGELVVTARGVGVRPERPVDSAQA